MIRTHRDDLYGLNSYVDFMRCSGLCLTSQCPTLVIINTFILKIYFKA